NAALFSHATLEQGAERVHFELFHEVVVETGFIAAPTSVLLPEARHRDDASHELDPGIGHHTRRGKAIARGNVQRRVQAMTRRRTGPAPAGRLRGYLELTHELCVNQRDASVRQTHGDG